MTGKTASPLAAANEHELERCPSYLDLQIENGSFICHCGVQFDTQQQAVLVAVVRNKGAAADVGYTIPTLEFLRTNISSRREVRGIEVSWRLPQDDVELTYLLKKSFPSR